MSGTVTGTKFGLTCACIFTGRMETDFHNTQENAPLVWHRYIDDIFLI